MYDPARDSWNGDDGAERPKLGQLKRPQYAENDEESAHDKKRVRSHYNSRQNMHFSERNRSKILGVRDFNNFVKSILIDRYARPRSIALDLACGKGGDLHKWARACVDGLIGVDIAEISIEHAKMRFDQMKHKTFWTDFCAGDAFSTPLADIVHPLAFPVDIVSCQFALHYAFSTEEQARTAIENIASVIKKDGLFIGTIPNSDYLSHELKKHQQWGNSLFNIRFEHPHPDGTFETPYGNRYFFTLKEAVEDVPEYVVPSDIFKELCAEYGLRCDMFMPFVEFFHDAVQNKDIRAAAIKKSLLNPDTDAISIAPDELAACSVYAAFAFTKIRRN